LRTTCVCNELNELQAGGRSFVVRRFWLLLKLRERWKLVGESTYSVVEMDVVSKSRLVGLLWLPTSWSAVRFCDFVGKEFGYRIGVEEISSCEIKRDDRSSW
jgi:hypothetical protein